MNIDDEEREARFEAILKENERLRKDRREYKESVDNYEKQLSDQQDQISSLEATLNSLKAKLYFSPEEWWIIFKELRKDRERRVAAVSKVWLVIGMSIGVSIGFFIGVTWE